MDENQYSPKALEILDAAERHMRRGGFDAVSYRDLASEVGIKSASVHYHFPQKASLGEAVVNRYASRLIDALGAPDDPNESPKQRLTRLCDVYRSALMEDNAVCLCCVLGAESQDVPEPVATAVKMFFVRVLDWTQTALEHGSAATSSGLSAIEIISTLQGAMVLALAVEQPTHFDVAVSRLLEGLG